MPHFLKKTKPNIYLVGERKANKEAEVLRFDFVSHWSQLEQYLINIPEIILLFFLNKKKVVN